MGKKKQIKRIYECQECNKSRMVGGKLYCLLRAKIEDSGINQTLSAEVDKVENCSWFKNDRISI